MPYYSFNKCPEKCLEEIAKVCKGIGLVEVVVNPPQRQWANSSSDVFWRAEYNPHFEKFPFSLETFTRTLYDPLVEPTVGRIMDITGSSQVYCGLAPRIQMDMSRFRQLSDIKKTQNK